MTTKVKLTVSDSPIDTKIVALTGKSFSELRGDVAGGVYWSCRDPSNQGKSTVLYHASDAGAGTGGATKQTDTSHNVRSAVHEYGGGAYCLHHPAAGAASRDGDDDAGLIYTDFPSHKVYWKKFKAETAVQIFPAAETKDDDVKSPCRLADFKVIQQAKSGSFVLLAVMEDHTDPKPANVQNSVVTVSLDGKATVNVVASGHDFYSSPDYDPTSQCYSFVAWDHPEMPWDATTLYVVDGDGAKIMAVHDQQCSVYAPQWYKGKLYFLSNVSGWYNLYCWNGTTTTPLLPREADFSEASNGWMLGVKCFTFLDNGTLVATYNNSEQGGSQVVLIDTVSMAVREFGRACLPTRSISCLAGSGNVLYFLGGSSSTPTGLWRWEKPGNADCVAMEVLSSMDDLSILPTIRPFMSEPKLIQFPSDTSLGTGYAYGYFYAPVQDNNNNSGIKPPLLVKAHGGPTARTETTFRIAIQFWTSRGFAVLDVDYGGSTGYNKAFQQSLKGKWGLLDVADVCHGAQYCADQGWVNPDWLCIDGGSAGGYTTLAALVFAKTFKAGASLYGIGDLTTLAEHTHKFESRYLDGLIGPYPEMKSLYVERSPINHTDKLSCPICLLQGDEDKIVPPDQAEKMFEMCVSKSLPSTLIIYKGEQHGFRKAANIGHALLSEYFFFCQTFGIQPQKEGGFDPVPLGTRVEM